MSVDLIPCFDQALDGVCQRLRGSITDLLIESHAPVDSPTELSKHLKLSKTLAWRACKIVSAEPARAVLEFLPAEGSVEMLLNACRRLGATEATLREARAALESLSRLVETHAGDRSTFDLMLSSMGGRDSGALLESRRQAYLGNSAVWGIQGQTRFACYTAAPSRGKNDGTVDTSVLGGLIGVRRLRPNVGLPLFMPHAYAGDGTGKRSAISEPIDVPGAGPLDLPLMREFCTLGAEELSVRPMENGAVRYDLVPGPIGNTSLNSWVFGYCDREFANIYATATDRVAEHGTWNFVPVEHLICDLLLHKSLQIGGPLTAGLFGQIGMSRGPYTGRQMGLPLIEEVVSLGQYPPAMSTPVIPRYSEMVRATLAKLGYPLDEFIGYRFAVKFPPIPTIALLSFPLANRPA